MIARWVVDNIPPSGTLVDLFAGGCAVTHAAMLSGKFERFIANDLGPAPEIFLSAVNGEFEGFAAVPTREEFYSSDDPVVRLLYSFGNNSTNYLWSPALERVKVPASRMVSAHSMHERRMAYIEFMHALQAYVEEMDSVPGCDRKHCGSLEGLERLQGLQGLQGLERLQGLEGLEGLERLEVTRLDYRDVEVPAGATVYADPPYRNTGHRGYAGEFDHDAFDDWLAEVGFPVVVSEYTAPAGCVEVAARVKTVTMAATKTGYRTERLFVQERFADEYRERMGREALFA